jgi:hypothetical protein
MTALSIAFRGWTRMPRIHVVPGRSCAGDLDMGNAEKRELQSPQPIQPPYPPCRWAVFGVLKEKKWARPLTLGVGGAVHLFTPLPLKGWRSALGRVLIALVHPAPCWIERRERFSPDAVQ